MKSTLACRQLAAILHKNLLLKCYSPMATLVEVRA